MVTVVTLNNSGKIELTKDELTELLEQARQEGFKEGVESLTRPYITTTGDWWNKQPTITYTSGDKTTLL